MNTFSSRQQTWFRSGAPICLALAVGLLFFAGCSKAKKPVATETPASASTDQSAADHTPTPPPAPSVAATPIAAPNGQPDMGELNRTLIRWIVRNRRPPANFADFAATAGVAIPPPPAGQKYIIAKNMHVQLVSQ